MAIHGKNKRGLGVEPRGVQGEAWHRFPRAELQFSVPIYMGALYWAASLNLEHHFFASNRSAQCISVLRRSAASHRSRRPFASSRQSRKVASS